jgi:pimeloyl-ACP methyl ester carboxylesterase
MIPSIRIPFLLVSLALIVLFFPVSPPANAQSSAPCFESADCPFEGGDWLIGENIDCGYVTVPADHKKDDGRTIRIAVAILRSTSSNPEPDPVIFLQGGPGLGSVTYAQGLVQSPLIQRIREKRDYILFDQRGSGYSGPELCPDLGRSILQTFARDLSLEEHQAGIRAAVVACRDSLLAVGEDLTIFNTVQSAADLRDLFAALPYSEYNVTSVSYGTRLALVAARDYPEGIRSMFLDSTLPIAGQNFDQSPAHIAHALDLLFAACAADSACNATYPDLEKQLYATIASFDENLLVVPVDDRDLYPTGTFAVNGFEIAYAFSGALSNTYLLPYMPLFIREVGAGNKDAMAAMIAAMSGGGASGDMHNSTFRSVMCYDEAPLSSLANFKSVAAQYPPSLNRIGYELDFCDDWPSGSATPDEVRPLHSDIPALILHGEYDRKTPPSFGREVASRLPNSFFYEFSGTGHYVSIEDSCAQGLVARFIDDPYATPDATCLSARPPLTFETDVYITGGIFRLMTGVVANQNLPHIIWIGTTLLTLLSSLLWPLAFIVRRIRRMERQTETAPKIARWLAAVTALLSLAFCIGLGAAVAQTVSSQPMMLAFGLPDSTRPLFLIPNLIPLLTIGVLGSCIGAWKRGYWTLPGRIHYSLILAASLSFVAFVGYWKLF